MFSQVRTDLIQISNECFSAEWDLHRELERAASRTAADTEVDEAIARLHAKKFVSFCKMLIIVVTDYYNSIVVITD